MKNTGGQHAAPLEREKSFTEKRKLSADDVILTEGRIHWENLNEGLLNGLYPQWCKGPVCGMNVDDEEDLMKVFSEHLAQFRRRSACCSSREANDGLSSADPQSVLTKKLGSSSKRARRLS